MEDVEGRIAKIQKQMEGLTLKLDQLRANIDELGGEDLMEDIIEELEEEVSGIELHLDELADDSDDAVDEELNWATDDIKELEGRIDKYLEPLNSL